MGKDFYESLAGKESAGNGGSAAENEGKYIGRYQMGEAALIDAGYYFKENKNIIMTGKAFGLRWLKKLW